MIEVIKFRRDTQFHKDFFIPDSFAHPAKMDAQLCLWLTERYSKPGDVILDPMAGMGTQMLACTIGRNVVLVELEGKFIKMQEQNWEIVKMKPQLGYEMGGCQIIQGDARNLEGLLADAIITSPPYAESLQADTDDGKARVKRLRSSGHDDIADRIEKANNWHQHEADYNPDNPDNIANLPYGNIDAVITSPPYEGSIIDGNENFEGIRKIRGDKASQKDKIRAIQFGKETTAYGKDNIGNLKGETYLQAMLQVYQQCHKVLKPEGLMILVLKNFIRDKKIVRLDLDTIKLCEQAGFELLERLYRKLPSQSFWRIIYHQKYPQVKQIEFEDVIAFRRL